MGKPIVNYIYPFDATQSKKITFTYTGDLPYQNRLIIYNAATMAKIYDSTSPSRVLYCTLPANTCQNGVKYAAAVQCYDMYGVGSSISDKVYFWCMEQPSFNFINISDGDVVTTSSFFAELFYAQAQSEKLSQYQFYIYDSTKVLLSSSQTFYSTDYMTYNYSGLEDDTIYYIRAKGLTQYGTELDTGYVMISVDTGYDNSKFNNINAWCDENNSVVTYHTNFVIVNSDEDGDDYEYDGSYINLLDNSLHYTTGINVSGDFLLCIRIRQYYNTAELLHVSDDQYGFTLSSYVYDDLNMRFKLTVPNGVTPYILYSDPYIPTRATVFTIYIKRINDIYQLYVFTSEEDYYHDMHWGINEPSVENADSADIWITNNNTPTVEVLKANVTELYMDEEPLVLAQNRFDIWLGRSDEQ